MPPIVLTGFLSEQGVKEHVASALRRRHQRVMLRDRWGCREFLSGVPTRAFSEAPCCPEGTRQLQLNL